jgi:hypothetical protein
MSSYLVGHVLKQIRPDLARTTPSPGATLRPTAELVSDPVGAVEKALGIDSEAPDGVSRPTGWMQRLARRGAAGAGVRRASGQPTYSGRVCCADWLSRFDGKIDQPYPIETTCPTCGAGYRIRLMFVHGG